MRYDPYRYLFLIVLFYQSSVPLFLDVFQCGFYLKYLTIRRMVSLFSVMGGECYAEYIYYIFEEILVALGNKET